MSTATRTTSMRLAPPGRGLGRQVLVLRLLLLLLRSLLPTGTLATLISLPGLVADLCSGPVAGLDPSCTHGLAERIYIATLLFHPGLQRGTSVGSKAHIYCKAPPGVRPFDKEVRFAAVNGWMDGNPEGIAQRDRTLVGRGKPDAPAAADLPRGGLRDVVQNVLVQPHEILVDRRKEGKRTSEDLRQVPRLEMGVSTLVVPLHHLGYDKVVGPNAGRHVFVAE